MSRKPTRQFLELLADRFRQGLHRILPLCAALAAVLLSAWAPPAPKRSAVPEIPDPTYRVKRGDRSLLYWYDAKQDRVRRTVAARHATGYEAYWRVLEIEDNDGLDEIYAKDWLVDVAPRTPVLVLEVERYDEKDPRHDCAIVRVLEGPLKSTKFWVATYDVNRLVPNPEYRPSASERLKQDNSREAIRARLKAYYDLPPEERRAIEEGARKYDAGTEIQVAENFRKSGKTALARKAYEKILRDYSDLPEAATARERLKTLPK